MTTEGFIILMVGIFLIIVIVVIIVGSLLRSQCYDCSFDNKNNTQCEDCEYYNDSLRHDYIEYCKKHNHFVKKGEKKDA